MGGAYSIPWRKQASLWGIIAEPTKQWTLTDISTTAMMKTVNTHRYISNSYDKLNSFSQIHFYFLKLQVDNCFFLVYCRSLFFWLLLLKIQPWIKYLLSMVISPFFLSVCKRSLVPTPQQLLHIVGSIEGGDVVWFGGFHSLFWGFYLHFLELGLDISHLSGIPLSVSRY